ncbi:hypothetical protein DFH06DRAFT_742828 [Mycena polygramma]|nr:hypothetical protein DFH06DRAFT_742828 [Mycena polygramma]
MSVSGIATHPDLQSQAMAAFKRGSKTKYMIFGLNDKKTQIVLLNSVDFDEETAPAPGKTREEHNYDKFVKDLTNRDPVSGKLLDGQQYVFRWGIYHLEYVTNESTPRPAHKFILFSWADDEAGIEYRTVRFQLPSSFAAMNEVMKTGKQIQANDLDTLDYPTVVGLAGGKATE